MNSLLISHDDFLQHISPDGHPENVDRLKVILAGLNGPEFHKLDRMDAVKATIEQLKLVHDDIHIGSVFSNIPKSGNFMLDGDTYLSKGSKIAALRAVGAVCLGVDKVIAQENKNVFCAVRPPGHHAEPDRPMGFCLFNSVAIGALYARMKYFCHRVAIIDFDVHHGNGTQTVAQNNKGMFYASSHQSPLYPGTGHIHDHGNGVIVNVPLPARSGGSAFKKAYESRIFPELIKFKPDFIFISAGFDAHELDPLADLNLNTDDYYWVTRKLVEIANTHCKGRLVSSLEGGYNLSVLGECVRTHVLALMET